MRIMYYDREQCDVVDTKMIHSINFSLFFSKNKKSVVIVVNSAGNPLGYLDYYGYLEFLDKKSAFQKFNQILKQNNYSTNYVYAFFENHIHEICLPIVDSNRALVGVYLKENDEISQYNHIAYTLAKVHLPVFASVISTYVINSFGNIYLSATQDEYKHIIKYIPQLKHINNLHNKEVNDNDIIIDCQYSLKLRNKIYGNLSVTHTALNDVVAAAIVPLMIDYVQSHNCKIIFIEGPISEKIKHDSAFCIAKSMTFEEALCQPLDDSFDKEVALSDNCIISNGIHLLMADYSSKNIVIKNGKRRTLPIVKERNKIHIFGSCLTYGACVQDSCTISSYLQQNINAKSDFKYRVLNHGVRNGKNVLNDFLYILNTRLMPGDVVIEINAFSSIVEKEILRCSEIHHFSNYYNTHNHTGCQFLDNTFHANKYVNKLLADYILSMIDYPQITKSIEYPSFCEENAFLNKIDVSYILSEGLLQHYKSYLRKSKVNITGVIGSVIITANPFTLGHAFLIEESLKRCDFLYIFVVQEDKFDFSFLDRLMMVKRATEHNDRVKVLTTGYLLTAPFTFPEYYTKDKKPFGNVANMPILHNQIFAQIIAPILNISVRFVGSEEECSVTYQYNRSLSSILPQWGIKVIQISRLHTDDNVISADIARRLIKIGDMVRLKKFVPPSTIQVLTSNNINRIPIRIGNWSQSYIVGKHFYKVFNFNIEEAIIREHNALLAVKKHNICTPKYYGLFKLSKTACMVFDYIPMTLLSLNNIDKKLIRESLYNIVNLFSQIKWPANDNFWYNWEMNEFLDALKHIENSQIYIEYLRSLKPEVFIHGDFSAGNIGLYNNNIIVYDFQHGALGPTGWDIAYFAAGYKKGDISFLNLSNEEMKMAQSIAAIKLGRAIRKSTLDITYKKEILDSWSGCL